MNYKDFLHFLLAVLICSSWTYFNSCVTGCEIIFNGPTKPGKQKDVTKNCASPCRGVELVKRREWGAANPVGKLKTLNDTAGYVIIHHTETPACYDKETCSKIVRYIQKQHIMKNNYLDIGYHLLIGGDGRVYEGRPINRCADHINSLSNDSISIAFIGTYDKECPRELSMAAFRRVIRCSTRLGFLSPDYRILGHRDVTCTPCPGDALYDLIRTAPRYLGPENEDNGICDVPIDSVH